MKNIFKEKITYSIIALVIVLFAEAFAVLAIHFGYFTFFPHVINAVIAVIFLWLLRWWCFGGNPFWVRSKILTRLMANAVSPSWIGAFYLLLFIIHLGWIGDGSLNFFLFPTDRLQEIGYSMAVALIGITILIEFFPEGKIEKKDGKKKKIFISGISALFNTPQSLKSEKYNMIPLVRILEETDMNEDFCEMLILLSDFYDPTKNNKNDNEKRNNVITQTISLSEKGAQYVASPDYANQTMTAKLEFLIRETAKSEFPNHDSWIDNNVKIHFTASCNYEKYSECFKLLSLAIKEYDTRENELCFNLTPGTAPISSIATLLSIDRNRKLYYYTQKADTNNKIIEIEKSDIPLENLLSQALESLKDQQ